MIVRAAVAPDTSDVVVVEAPQRSTLAMTVKRIIQTAYSWWVSPLLLSYRLNQPIWGKDRAFLAASEKIGMKAGMHGVYCRQAFYRATLASCGQDAYFGWGCLFAMPAAKVGHRAYLGRRCGIGFADIGDDVMLADGVQILSGGREHRRSENSNESHQDQPQEFRKVTIGHGAWIGTNAVIMADIGPGSIIGAGAVVTKPIPPRCVAVGIPAKVIKSLDES